MSKYWFGSLEHIGVQHDSEGHLAPTTLKPVKGWKVKAREDYPDPTQKENAFEYERQIKADRDKLAESWWADAEVWYLSRPNQIDLKGNELNPDTRYLDHVPIRETNDYQLRITGPIEVPDEAPKKGSK